MRITMKRALSVGALVTAVILSGCAGGTQAPTAATGVRDIPSASKSVGRYKVGKPYQINGTWYQPEEDFDYEEVGMASWYGRQFHGKMTANGETYDMDAMTAAHRTLPLPSVVRVTNLDNNRTVKLRVNDRGPFAKGRIIDVSRRAAQVLDFQNKGVTRVKVEIVADESMALANRQGSGGNISNSSTQVGLTPNPAVAALNRNQLTSVKVAPRARAVVVAPVAAPSAARRTRTYIQAGSFADPSNAHRVRSRLSGLGPVEVRELQVEGRGFYRVRLGPLASNDRADEVLADVIRAGYPSSRIVSE